METALLSGKGSTQRPLAVDAETFATNWEAIFGGKPSGTSDQELTGEQEARYICSGAVRESGRTA